MREYVTITAGATDAQSLALKQQYFALRSRAYGVRWGEGVYPAGADVFDEKPDTTYVLKTEGGKVVAGLRMLMHKHGSDEKLPIEKHAPFGVQAALLPHLDTKTLSYAELGGLAADPDEKYRKQHLGSSIVAEMLKRAQSGAITNNGKPLDVLVSCVTSAGLGPAVRGASETTVQGIVRQDLVIEEEDKRFDTKLWPILFAPKADFPLQSPEMKAKGAGIPIGEFKLPEQAKPAQAAARAA